jgi:fructosamine-3-kinase
MKGKVMNINKIIIELIRNHIIHAEPTRVEQLKGGTVSELYLLEIGEIKYVVKLNNPLLIESEALFLNYYKQTNFVPELVFVDPSNHFIVYSFVTGSTDYDRKNKKVVLQALVQNLLNKYQLVSSENAWGWADQPTDSWASFIRNEVLAATEIIGTQMNSSDHLLVLNLVERHWSDVKPFLIHGDCGVHNFIFKDGGLVGVIDPTPVIGDPLYDLLYAFCSSPDDLTQETIDFAVKYVTFKNEINHHILYEQVLILLYLRLATCLKHHPEDLKEYLQAWGYWKDLIKKRAV